MLLSVFFGCRVMRELLTPFEDKSIFLMVVSKMLTKDIGRRWLFVFALYILMFWVSFWVVIPFESASPSADFWLDHAYDGTTTALMLRSFWSLVLLSFAGEPLSVDWLGPFNFRGEWGAQTVAVNITSSWQILLYFLFLVISLVLLLNLLIAMMGDTYSDVRDESEVVCRWLFARRVLRMELLLKPFVSIDALRIGKRSHTRERYLTPSTPIRRTSTTPSTRTPRSASSPRPRPRAPAPASARAECPTRSTLSRDRLGRMWRRSCGRRSPAAASTSARRARCSRSARRWGSGRTDRRAARCRCSAMGARR